MKGAKSINTESTNVKNLAILFSGNGSNLENIVLKLRDTRAHGHTIKIPIAISSRRDAFGIERCKRLGLKCEVVASCDYKNNAKQYDEDLSAILRNHDIDLVVLAGFMRILGAGFCTEFKAINIHPSILPLFKGAHGIAESYQSDMKIAGVSVHWVSSELDSGEIIAQDSIPKIRGESLEDFESRIHALEHRIYPSAIVEALFWNT